MILSGHKADCRCFVCEAHRKQTEYVQRRKEVAQFNGVQDCGHNDCILCNPDSCYNVAMRERVVGKGTP